MNAAVADIIRNLISCKSLGLAKPCARTALPASCGAKPMLAHYVWRPGTCVDPLKLAYGAIGQASCLGLPSCERPKEPPFTDIHS